MVWRSESQGIEARPEIGQYRRRGTRNSPRRKFHDPSPSGIPDRRSCDRGGRGPSRAMVRAAHCRDVSRLPCKKKPGPTCRRDPALRWTDRDFLALGDSARAAGRDPPIPPAEARWPCTLPTTGTLFTKISFRPASHRPAAHTPSKKKLGANRAGQAAWAVSHCSCNCSHRASASARSRVTFRSSHRYAIAFTPPTSYRRCLESVSPVKHPHTQFISSTTGASRSFSTSTEKSNDFSERACREGSAAKLCRGVPLARHAPNP